MGSVGRTALISLCVYVFSCIALAALFTLSGTPRLAVLKGYRYV